MSRTLLIEGERTFRISIPDDAKVTFGPWSPPNGDKASRYGSDGDGARRGTLRIYKGTKENIVACFSGVKSFRDLSIDYSELVAKEEGATLWKSDQNGYEREEKVKREQEWVEPLPALGAGKKTRKK